MTRDDGHSDHKSLTINEKVCAGHTNIEATNVRNKKGSEQYEVYRPTLK